MLRKKITMLGSFAVGKTSLVRRFVSGIFSERYLTTLGVRVDKKQVEIDGTDVTLVLWDLHGEDEFQTVRGSYVRGSAGYFLVIDGTRRSTLDVALQLHELALASAGAVPCCVLLNKADLADSWEIGPDDIADLESRGFDVVRTSALSGDAVEEAFHSLAQRILAANAGS